MGRLVSIIGAFNQEEGPRALVGAFSVIVKLKTSPRLVSSSNRLSS